MAKFMSKARSLTIIVRPALYQIDGNGQKVATQEAHLIAFKNGYYETEDLEEIRAILRAGQHGETITQIDYEVAPEAHHVTPMVTGASSSAPLKSIGPKPENEVQQGQLDKAMGMLEQQGNRIDELNTALGKAIDAIKQKDETIAMLKEGVAKMKPVVVYHCKKCGKPHRSIAAARWCCEPKEKK